MVKEMTSLPNDLELLKEVTRLGPEYRTAFLDLVDSYYGQYVNAYGDDEATIADLCWIALENVKNQKEADLYGG